MGSKAHGDPNKDPCSARNGQSHSPRQPGKIINIGSQRVDPRFNELLTKFNFIRSNIEALYHSCENYKTSMRSFFYRSIKIMDLYCLVLDDSKGDSHTCSTQQLPTSMLEAKERTTDILKDFYARTGLPDDYRDICISRLSKQMFVITRKVEDDFAFFENGVQGPLKAILQVCTNIARTVAFRAIANSELSAIDDKIKKVEQTLQNTASSAVEGQKIDGLNSDPKLKKAIIKFEIINSMLKDQLETFEYLISKFMSQWFKNYYYTTFRIAYAIYHSSWNSPEFKKVLFRGFSHNSQDSISNNDILTNFHVQNDVAARELESLSITNFKSYYKSTLDFTEKLRMEGFL